MKTSSVRISDQQAKKLHDVADLAGGPSINAMVQMAVDLWLEVEYPVYKEALEGAHKKLESKRQAVRAERVAS